MSRLRVYLKNTSLKVKIRLTYVALVVPIIILLIFGYSAMFKSAERYNEMINSAALAGEFSLDFKKDFDYETYLLIVGNKTTEESKMSELLEDANRVIDGLEEITTDSSDTDRLRSVKKYLGNLEKYKARIEANLSEEDKYDDNMQIWENDVQIVTSLIREEVFNFIYYEIRDMQTEREEMENFYYRFVYTSVVACVVIGILLVLFSIYLPASIAKPITQLVKVTKRVAQGDLTVRSDIVSKNEVGVLSESLNIMIDKTNELLAQITKEQVRIREAELELLQSQINPHFLYNTLDTIVWLAEGGYQKEVVSMVKSLSAFFRTSISRGKDVITISEEMVHARSYLEIQRFRYQDILNYDINIPDELGNYLIPKITIQPLIENALYHGIKNKRGGGKIVVSARILEDGFDILVSDDGIGMTDERLKQVKDGISSKAPSEKKIYGLYNVNERIKLKFGKDYGLNIESQEDIGTTSIIHLPKITEENKKMLSKDD